MDEQATRASRPRVTGEREDAILDATISVLCEVGYDRLTMDQVAAQAHASKATLYRRWDTKAELVVDAVVRAKAMPADEPPDTGSLRGDLMADTCGPSGWAETLPMSVLAGLITAVNADTHLRDLWQERFLEPRLVRNRIIFDRARSRGEIPDDVDIDLLGTLLPSTCSFRALVVGQPVDEAFVASIIDSVMIPAAASGRR
jgi:AcrR family transcriptional regulator